MRLCECGERNGKKKDKEKSNADINFDSPVSAEGTPRMSKEAAKQRRAPEGASLRMW